MGSVIQFAFPCAARIPTGSAVVDTARMSKSRSPRSAIGQPPWLLGVTLKLFCQQNEDPIDPPGTGSRDARCLPSERGRPGLTNNIDYTQKNRSTIARNIPCFQALREVRTLTGWEVGGEAVCFDAVRSCSHLKRAGLRSNPRSQIDRYTSRRGTATWLNYGPSAAPCDAR